ncbi:carbon-nitrogen hydrolase family protein [Campylobacter sp. LR264d]|uniref:carbon-nitrogen hydrolase family protein n=1 Tax=Campylobacter sp. LR264d TaxID=2593544 RepID=UPI00123B156C|nr:carbon-nitrogen hydrolase family protein [Campylobacter sp. LR264d]KAA6233754.1 carbon-nitrogen hydrolase family protein [Campylobacter sp. LR264d]
MSKILKVALIQFSPISYDRKANLKKSLNLAKNALEDGAKIVLFPELFDSGYCIEDRDKEFGLDFSKNEIFSKLLELAKTYKAYMIACSIEKVKSKLYDTAYVIGKKGILGKYRKIYLWGDEIKRFKSGNEYPVFKLNFDEFSVKVGLQICYEIGFGEGARFLALKGAEILCYMAAFGKARNYVWDLASKVRALENGQFILACNRSGSEISKLSQEELLFAGNSRIINPKGEILGKITQKEGVLIREIDLEEVAIQRENLPYLKDIDLKLNSKILKKIIKEKKWLKKKF